MNYFDIFKVIYGTDAHRQMFARCRNRSCKALLKWKRSSIEVGKKFRLISYENAHEHTEYTVNKEKAILKVIKSFPPGTNLHAIRHYVTEKT